MIVIGGTYYYEGKKVTVDSGDRNDQTWNVTVIETGRQIMGVMTSQLKERKD